MRKLLILFIAFPIIVFGQVNLEEGLKNEIMIEGNVSDVHGLPLTGADILIKGKSNVIKTDFDGNFNLKAEKGTVLVIGSSGFKTKEFTVENQVKVNIILEDEVTSEKTKALTKSDYRKKRRADNKARRDAQREKNTNDIDLNNEILKAVGRSAKGAIRKKQQE
ncbi:carboxypeptidase-like regulatory domain-containing protein [Flavisericum labens]|uniref:carboxypeptidase-like regulatory domain-containing protein n=1 Tax=Flavisericum labens TaxID=3377112 RepID=UPI00387AF03A